MPRTVTPLTDTKIRQTTPASTPIRLSDGGGLYLLVQPDGAKWWRFNYETPTGRKTLSFGVYPTVTLAKARRQRESARAQLLEGRDPSAERQAAKAAPPAVGPVTFKAIADEWLAQQQAILATATHAKATWMLSTLVGPWLGARPIAEIEPPEVLAVLRRIESRGRISTAHRTREKIGQVFRYAVATGQVTRDPTPDLRGALQPDKPTHRAAITDPVAIGALLRALDSFAGTFVVACALRLAPYVFVRPGELRHAEWTEIDLKTAEWRIPAAKTKMRAPHLVPLSRQAVKLLRELHPLTGAGRYVFPSIRVAAVGTVPMSENTLNVALRRLGYDRTSHVAHGFRAMASTRLHELGWPSDVIERQLAHAPRNKVKAAYDRAQHVAERRKMMQAWADYLDALKAKKTGTKVVPISSAARRRTSLPTHRAG